MKKYKVLFAAITIAVVCGLCSVGVSAEETAVTQPVTTPETVTEVSVTTVTSVSETDTAQTDVTETTDETVVDFGWKEDSDGKRYYISESGEKLTGYQQIDGREYYFSANGTLKSGFYTINDIRMYFSPENYERQLGWIDYNDSRFYLDENGKTVGMKNIDGKDYMFDEYGVCTVGWFEYGGSKYYSDYDNGIFKNECVIEGEKYYFSPAGRFKSGWVTSSGIRIFYDYETTKPVYGWISYNGNLYYSDEVEGKCTGDKVIDGVKYRFDSNGCQQTGLQEFSDGIRYYDEKGKAISGLVTIDENKYCFAEKTYLMQTGLQTIDGKRYYFDANGIMQTGLQKIEGNSYYFDKNGVMQTGFQKIEDNMYYFDANGVMQTGWQTIDGKKYCFDSNGIMLTNQVIDNYEIGADGVAVLISEIRQKARDIIKSIGDSLEAVYNYVNTQNIYRFMEPTRSLAEIEKTGWSYFAEYALNNRFVVCYYFAAAQGLLFEAAGYEARIVYGTGYVTSDHYWNQVKINGEWRNFDACNGLFNVSDAYLKENSYTVTQYVYPEYN